MKVVERRGGRSVQDVGQTGGSPGTLMHLSRERKRTSSTDLVFAANCF